MRGTPVLIDLGFDPSEDFHRYAIEGDPNLRYLFEQLQQIECFRWCYGYGETANQILVATKAAVALICFYLPSDRVKSRSVIVKRRLLIKPLKTFFRIISKVVV